MDSTVACDNPSSIDIFLNIISLFSLPITGIPHTKIEINNVDINFFI